MAVLEGQSDIGFQNILIPQSFRYWEAVMKKGIVFFAVIFLFLLIASVQGWAQDSVQISVKRSDVFNGVVIVTGLEGKTPLELQCNQGVSSCNVLQPGNYFMLRLPKNRGLYDCANAHVYRNSADPA